MKKNRLSILGRKMVLIAIAALFASSLMVMQSCKKDDSGEVVPEVPEADPVTFTSFAPDNGSYGDQVTITGTNFGTDKSKVSVTINGKVQTVDAVTDTEITLTLAEKTFSGDMVVTVDGTTLSGGAYTYVETYSVEGFSTGDRAGFLEVDKTGNIFRSFTNAQLYKTNANGTGEDTLLYSEPGVYPNGLFCADNGVVYIADGIGRILYIPAGSSAIDTLIKVGADANLAQDYPFTLTGDNAGNIYVGTSAYGKSVVKINVSTKQIEVIFTSTENVGGLTYANGRIFATTKNGISSFKTDGSDKQTLQSAYPFSLSYSDLVTHSSGQIYLFSSHEEKLYKLSTTGNLTEVVLESGSFSGEHQAIDENVDGDLLVGYNGIQKVVIK